MEIEGGIDADGMVIKQNKNYKYLNQIWKLNVVWYNLFLFYIFYPFTLLEDKINYLFIYFKCKNKKLLFIIFI